VCAQGPRRMEKSFKILRYLISAVILYSCSKPVSNFSVSERISGFSIKKTQNGIPQWEIEGSKLVKGKKISLEASRGRFYEKGRQKYFVKADKAVFTEEGDYLELNGNVVIKNAADGTELYLNDLAWDEKRQVYFTDNRVRQVSKDSVVLGDGLTSDRDLNRIEIKNPHVKASDKK